MRVWCGLLPEDYVYPFIHRLLIWVGRAGRAGGHPMNPSPKMAPPKPTAALHAHAAVDGKAGRSCAQQRAGQVRQIKQYT